MPSRKPILDVKHLRLVAAIAREKSITAAAPGLHLSQSALSHQLINLEESIGRPLFERVGKRMVPTATGARLAEAGTDILHRLQEAETASTGAVADDRRPLRIAASCSTLYGWLAQQVALFTVQAPDLDPRIAFDVRGHEVEALLKGNIDIAITNRPGEDRRLMRRSLFAVETVALLASRHPLASRSHKGPLRWSDLAGETVLIHDLPEDDVTALRAAVGHRSERTRISRVQLTEAIEELARAGQGVGVLSRWPDASWAKKGLVVRSMSPPHRRAFSAVYRKTDANEAIVSFLSHLAAGRPKRPSPGL